MSKVKNGFRGVRPSPPPQQACDRGATYASAIGSAERGTGCARCGWCRPLAAPRWRSRQHNPRLRPFGPCSFPRRLYSRSFSTKASPATRSGNGVLPKSRRDDTRQNENNPAKRGPYGAWLWWAVWSTRPTSRLRSPSQRMMAPSWSRRWCTSRWVAKRPPRWQPSYGLSAAQRPAWRYRARPSRAWCGPSASLGRRPTRR